jgi:hypothetical protein
VAASIARGIQLVAARPSNVEIFADSTPAERAAAGALSAGGSHDRFASRHELDGKVNRRLGDGSYNPS